METMLTVGELKAALADISDDDILDFKVQLKGTDFIITNIGISSVYPGPGSLGFETCTIKGEVLFAYVTESELFKHVHIRVMEDVIEERMAFACEEAKNGLYE